MKKFSNKLIIGVVVIFVVSLILMRDVYVPQEQSMDVDLESNVIVLGEDSLLPDEIVPITIDTKVSPMKQHNLPPELTDEYVQKQKQLRAEKLLGTSLVQVAGGGTLSIPFVLGEEIELLSTSGYAINEWISSSKFIFTDYGDGPCGFPCKGDKYIYDIETKARTPVVEEKEEWKVSPNGELAFKHEQGSTKEPTKSLGVFYLKDTTTGEVRNLGRAVRSTSYDGSYTGSCLWAFEWSPDSQNIGMFDWCKYDNGPAVYVLPVSANDISERRFLGFTRYKETARPWNEKLISWSPDSTKFYARDSYVVFDIISDKELFRPKDKTSRLFSWSPDSKKMITIAGSLGFAVVDAVSGKMEGYLFTKMPVGFQSKDIAWMPDSRYVLVVDWGYGRKGYVYYIDTKTRTFGRIDETEAESPYSNLLVSPDAKRLIYVDNQKIVMRILEWR